MSQVVDPDGIVERHGCVVATRLADEISAADAPNVAVYIANNALLRQEGPLSNRFWQYRLPESRFFGKVITDPLALRTERGGGTTYLLVYINDTQLGAYPDLLAHELAHALVVVRGRYTGDDLLALERGSRHTTRLEQRTDLLFHPATYAIQVAAGADPTALRDAFNAKRVEDPASWRSLSAALAFLPLSDVEASIPELVEPPQEDAARRVLGAVADMRSGYAEWQEASTSALALSDQLSDRGLR